MEFRVHFHRCTMRRTGGFSLAEVLRDFDLEDHDDDDGAEAVRHPHQTPELSAQA